MKNRNEYNPRYAYVTCSKCNHKWQRLDYGCSLHQLTCGYPVPEQIEPHPMQALTTEQWAQFDCAHGISGRLVGE